MTEQERIREDEATRISATTFVARVVAAVRKVLAGWRALVSSPPPPPPSDAVTRAVDRMREHLTLVKKQQATKTKGD